MTPRLPALRWVLQDGLRRFTKIGREYRRKERFKRMNE